MQWHYAGDAMLHLAMETKLFLRPCTGSKIQFSEDTGRIVEDELQKEKG